MNILEHVACIQLDVRLWSGQCKLCPADLKLAAGSEIPPATLASLGSKRLCDPRDLAPGVMYKIGIRAFHLRCTVHPVGYGEFFGVGSRFIVAARSRTRQVLVHSTRVNSGVTRRTEFQNILGRVHIAVMVRTAVTGPLAHPQSAHSLRHYFGP